MPNNLDFMNRFKRTMNKDDVKGSGSLDSLINIKECNSVDALPLLARGNMSQI